MELETAGIRVRADDALQVAALRHFDPSAFGFALPGPLKAIGEPGDGVPGARILAWRSPTETWMLCNDPAAIAQLQAHSAASTACCVVDQSGGIAALRVSGERRADLMERLGSSTAIPQQGEALMSRLAEVAVMALSLDGEEILLLVERVYLDHLSGWIRETLADL